MWLKFKTKFCHYVGASWLVAVLISSNVFAAANGVTEFNSQSWAQLLGQTKQAAIVVFTSTDCSHCPAVVDYLKTYLQAQPANASKIPLYLVVMDGQDEPDLLSQGHYLQADKLLAFSGNRNALQYGVNPKWRGLTPYVAFITHHQAEFVVGKPEKEKLNEFTRKARASF